MKSIKLLGVRIDDINRQKLEVTFAEFLHNKKLNHIATVNPEFLVEANKNQKFREILNTTSLNICDGIGISLISRVFFGKKINRITGVEVAENLCKICEQEKKTIYFIGGFSVAKTAAEAMQKKYPQLKIAGYEDGNPMKISDKLRAAQPDAILVAFGAPAQEKYIKKLATELPSLRIGIGIGGTFDFWAGKTTRAPKILRTIGLEWLWRLILEPKIRRKRILRAVCVFPYLVVKNLLGK